MYYYIYKITNINTGRFYIGSHKTTNLDDGYFGSGLYLKRSIKKYGKDSFIKENIVYCNNAKHMLHKETEILQKYKSNPVYNLKFCSSGGNTREKYTKNKKQAYIQKLINNPKSPIGKKGKYAHNYGSQSSNETRLKQSNTHRKRFALLKANTKEWNKWRQKYIPHALKNQKIMTEIISKPVKITRISTGKTLFFKSKAQCGRYLGLKSLNIIQQYVLGKCKNNTALVSRLKQYKIELL